MRYATLCGQQSVIAYYPCYHERVTHARGLLSFVRCGGAHAAATYAAYGAAFALALVVMMGLLGGDAIHGALFRDPGGR